MKEYTDVTPRPLHILCACVRVWIVKKEWVRSLSEEEANTLIKIDIAERI